MLSAQSASTLRQPWVDVGSANFAAAHVLSSTSSAAHATVVAALTSKMHRAHVVLRSAQSASTLRQPWVEIGCTDCAAEHVFF